MIGNNHKGETLYLWRISSGETKIKVWKGFGDIETHPKYQGEVENGVPNGLGFMIYPNGNKYVGSWKNGKKNEGTYTWSKGDEYVGEYKDGKTWNGTGYDKNGNIEGKTVNGEYTKQKTPLQNQLINYETSTHPPHFNPSSFLSSVWSGNWCLIPLGHII